MRHAPRDDRIRWHTAPKTNERIDRDRERAVAESAGHDARALQAQIDAIDRMWDVERVIEAEASLVGLTAAVLGATKSRAFGIAGTIVSSVLLLHAVSGWYPWLPLMRRLGVRSQSELAAHRYALQAAMGDFERVNRADGETAWEATRPAPADRVRENTASEIDRLVDEGIRRCLNDLSDAEAVRMAEHLAELDREWDVERYLQANAALFSGLGAALGMAADRRIFALSMAVFGFLLQHAVQGWCPPMPLFRRLGVRTRREIDREKYAVKALRGDFARANARVPVPSR